MWPPLHSPAPSLYQNQSMQFPPIYFFPLLSIDFMIVVFWKSLAWEDSSWNPWLGSNMEKPLWYICLDLVRRCMDRCKDINLEECMSAWQERFCHGSYLGWGGRRRSQRVVGTRPNPDHHSKNRGLSLEEWLHSGKWGCCSSEGVIKRLNDVRWRQPGACCTFKFGVRDRLQVKEPSHLHREF